MELNRNHYFMVGCVILFLGLQVKAVESFTLSESASQYMSEKIAMVSADDTPAVQISMLPEDGPVSTAQRTLNPPRWLGWAFVSVGAVLILHSLAMKGPH